MKVNISIELSDSEIEFLCNIDWMGKESVMSPLGMLSEKKSLCSKGIISEYSDGFFSFISLTDIGIQVMLRRYIKEKLKEYYEKKKQRDGKKY